MSASGAQGQSKRISQAASARAFFRQGVRLADKGRTEEAVDRFRRAIAIRYSPVIAFNLASMLEIQGQLVEACELLYRIQGDEDAGSALQESAQRLQVDIESRIAHLTITVDASISDSQVELDEMTLIPEQLGAPIPVDPTMHHVRLLRHQAMVEQHELTLEPAAEEFIHLGAPIVPPPQQVAVQAAPEAPPFQPATPTSARDGLIYSPWLWTGVGVAVAGVVAVVAALTLSGSSSGGQVVAAP